MTAGIRLSLHIGLVCIYMLGSSASANSENSDSKLGPLKLLATRDWQSLNESWEIKMYGSNDMSSSDNRTRFEFTPKSGKIMGETQVLTFNIGGILSSTKQNLDMNGDGADELYVPVCWHRACAPIVFGEESSRVIVLFEGPSDAHHDYKVKDVNGNGMIEILRIPNYMGTIPQVFSYSKQKTEFVRDDRGAGSEYLREDLRAKLEHLEVKDGWKLWQKDQRLYQWQHIIQLHIALGEHELGRQIVARIFEELNKYYTALSDHPEWGGLDRQANDLNRIQRFSKIFRDDFPK